jgi:poly(ribitol-phosphate) beta-N-acetylglucosaminyltransferase
VRDAVLDATQQVFGERFVGREPQVRERLVERARVLLGKWLTPPTAARLPSLDRVKAELISRGMGAELHELARAMAAGERGKDVIAGGRVYGGYPFFRDAAVGVPDECYDVTGELAVRHHLAGLSWAGSRLRLTGHAYIEHVDTAGMVTEVVLRDRGGAERRWAVRPEATAGLAEDCGLGHYDYGLAGFDVVLDLADAGGAPLPAGQWGVFAAVSAQGISKEAPLGGSRAAGLEAGPADAAYFTKYGTLTLRIPATQPAGRGL